MVQCNNFGKKSLKKSVFMAFAAVSLVACNKMLPHEDIKNPSTWPDFAAVQNAFDQIEPKTSKLEDIQSLGFDPIRTSNTDVLNYVDLMNTFSNAFSSETLPEGVKSCLAATERCVGYVFRIENINRQRIGNPAVDLLGFKKQTHITGWRFVATIALVDNVVVYKRWTGTPDIEQYENRSIPLGPLQNIGDMLVP